MASWVLGIAGSHDGAHCLLRGGRIVCASREERLTGVKRARVRAGRGGLGLRYCLDAAGITVNDLAVVVSANQRSARHAENDVTLNPQLRSIPHLRRMTVTHHLAHAASAVACSGFNRCAVLVCDGSGSPFADLDVVARACALDSTNGALDETSEHLTLFRAAGAQITPIEVHVCRNWVDKKRDGMWHFNSLGGMFSAVARQIFGSPNEAGKVMGLAPYGRPCFPIEEFLVIDDYRIRFTNGVQRYFQHDARWPENPERYRDLAASVQAALEHTLLHLVRRLRAITDERHLCLAGGVALNSVANERILRDGGFDDVFIVPAADDSGTAIGAAYLGHWASGGSFGAERIRVDGHGRVFDESELMTAIAQMPDLKVDAPDDLLDETVTRLRRGEIGGWFMGGAEFGPRALGQRSIVASPLAHNAKDRINAGVKFRESFRPFAPAVLAEHADRWFSFGATPASSPFMLRVVPFLPDRAREVPAVVHVDGTGRLQTLTRGDNGRFYELVKRFFDATGVPILLNTSMNLRDEPIVETPEDALWMLLGTDLSFCVVGDRLVTKRKDARLILDYVPFVVAQEWRMHLGVAEGRLERSIGKEDAIVLDCDTPWGRSSLTLPLGLLPLLAAIDGVLDGRALHRKLTADSASALSELDLAHDLLLLRRMKAIRLQVRP
jgi:carbamoyltransferase